MPRSWEDYYHGEERIAYGRWAEKFLDELQKRLDHARACIHDEEGAGMDTAEDAMKSIKTLVNDEERGIPE